MPLLLKPKHAPLLNAVDFLSRSWLFTTPRGHWIFGLPKSGTTVFAAALSEVTGSSALLDTPMLWGTAIRPLDHADMKALVSAHPLTFSPKLWKEPNATFYPEAAMAASQADRHILLVRAPFQNIRSHMDRLGLKGDAKSVDLAALHPNHRPAFLEHPDSPPALTLARRWQETHSKACWKAPEVQVHTYEAFMANPLEVLHASAAHLGLSVLHEPIRSLAKQQQPRGANRNVSPEAFFGKALCQEIEGITASAFKHITGNDG